MKFVPDHTIPAVENEGKHKFGKDGPPKHMRPVVTVNPKSLARKQLAAAQFADDEASQTE